jgi:hypothetical protein
LAEKEEELEQERQRLREEKSQFEPKRQALNERQGKLDKREQALAAKEEGLEQERQQLSERESRIEDKQQALAERQGKLDKREQNLKKDCREDLLPELFSWEEEKELVEHIRSYISGSGFYYDNGIVEDFYTCLKVNYLTVLSGISGTGKSKLPRLFAQAIGAHFKLISVRPSWHDDRDLLGFFNFREDRYVPTEFLEALVKAQEQPDRLHIICLDEMNLAPVEHYFAKFLSILENLEEQRSVEFPPDIHFTKSVKERVETELTMEWVQATNQRDQSEDRSLLEQKLQALERRLEALDRYLKVEVTPNVRFVGTVNIDHTTQGFSDKVIDRVDVIQFESANLDANLQRTDVSGMGLSYQQFEEFCTPSLSQKQRGVVREYMKEVKRIHRILSPAGAGFGFRVLQSMECFMEIVVNGEYLDLDTAFDFEIKQRILPKIRGMDSSKMEQALKELANFLDENGYEKSRDKIIGSNGMLQQLQKRGYVNYWETR